MIFIYLFYFFTVSSKSFSLQAEGKIGLLHHDGQSTVGSLVVVFSLVWRQSIICCLAALCVIPCRESGRPVLLSGSWRGWEYSIWRDGPCCDTGVWNKKPWACKTRQIIGFIFLYSKGAVIHSVLHGVIHNTSATCFCDTSHHREKVHVTFGHECHYVRCVSVILCRNSNGFHRGECCSPSEAKWESGEII